MKKLSNAEKSKIDIIDSYIESNKKMLLNRIEEYSKLKPDEESEIKRVEKNITILQAYIMGLEDAKKYIKYGEEL